MILLTAFRCNETDERKLKPEILYFGVDGRPIQDEVESNCFRWIDHMTNAVFFRQVSLILLSCILGPASAHATAGDAPSVTFDYTFGTPHRMTVALPDSSGKTLLDAYPGRLEML